MEIYRSQEGRFNMSYKVSRNFWKTIDQYPDYPHLLKRRFLDLTFILEHYNNAKSFLDVGCADCSMLILLKELTPIKQFYGVDISDKLMRDLPWAILKVEDLTKTVTLPKTDVTISFGMFPYIFKEKDLITILENVRSDLFLVRVPCTMQDEDDYINKFSEELDNEYSSIYRTTDSYVRILSKEFNVQLVFRSYPDEIEGKYNTKHYYFVCRR